MWFYNKNVFLFCSEIWNTRRSKCRKEHSPKWKVFHLCRLFLFMRLWNNKFLLLNFLEVENLKIEPWSGKFFTSSIWAKFFHTRRSRCQKNSPKCKFSTSVECSKSFDFGKKIVWNFLEVENFPPNRKLFTFSIWAEILDTRKSRCQNNFPYVENFTPQQNVPIHVI